jgi:uroporphyrinogen-III synthase
VAVLVTRPHPEAETTASELRARGFEVLIAPMLRYERVAFQDDADTPYDAVIVTSANALRGEPAASRLLKLPLFAVGERTASAAREAGFETIVSAKGDAADLRDLVLSRVKSKALKKAATLLYLAGADLARDLAAELGERGFTVVTQTTYRMVPLSSLPDDVRDAFAGNRIDAVLHYSRRSVRAFFDAVRAAGLEISALSIPHCCISAAVASVIRDAGATQVMVAVTPDENALLALLDRALRG